MTFQQETEITGNHLKVLPASSTTLSRLPELEMYSLIHRLAGTVPSLCLVPGLEDWFHYRKSRSLLPLPVTGLTETRSPSRKSKHSLFKVTIACNRTNAIHSMIRLELQNYSWIEQSKKRLDIRHGALRKEKSKKTVRISLRGTRTRKSTFFGQSLPNETERKN